MLLSQIFIYPIKSVRGIAVSEIHLDSSGPLQDRRWMMMDEEGLFLSQRKLPRMVLIETRFEGSDLVVTAPGMSPLAILTWSGEGEWVPVRIWGDHLTLPHPDQAYSDWFSSFLGRPCRLVYLPDAITRYVEPPSDDPKWRVSLADGYPLLVVTQASLDLLNTRLQSSMDVERFRPNLVISGAAPHAEVRGDSYRSGQLKWPSLSPALDAPPCWLIRARLRSELSRLERSPSTGECPGASCSGRTPWSSLRDSFVSALPLSLPIQSKITECEGVQVDT